MNEIIPATNAKKPKYSKISIKLSENRIVSIYAGKKVADALAVVSEQMNLYKGVRLIQLLEAVYDQALKEGRKEVFDKVDALKREFDYRNPGAPRKQKKLKAKKRN